MKVDDIKKGNRYSEDLNKYFNKLLIYKLTFDNGKIYIGQTKNLRKRLYFYLSKGESKHFVKRAILKHGINSVDFEILHIAKNLEELNNLEIFYIRKYESYKTDKGYNLTLGGLVCEVSPQTILKKISSSKKTKVGQYDLEGTLIKVFNSVKEASRCLNIPDTDIHRCCKTKGQRLGFLFSKCLSDKIEPIREDKLQGKWNKKLYIIEDVLEDIEIECKGIQDICNRINISRTHIEKSIDKGNLIKKRYKIKRKL